MLDKFSISDWIEFCGVLVSMFIGIVSIVVAVLTLRQNSKMIAESTRPYVVVSFERTFTAVQRNYFVIKNYGQTGAYINKFECLTKVILDDLEQDEMADQIQTVQNSFLAPGQKLCLPFNSPLSTLDVAFALEYCALKKVYNEVFSLHIPNLPAFRGHTSKGGKPQYLKDISHSMQEMVEREF